MRVHQRVRWGNHIETQHLNNICLRSSRASFKLIEQVSQTWHIVYNGQVWEIHEEVMVISDSLYARKEIRKNLFTTFLL